jgi:heat shock protein HslJ
MSLRLGTLVLLAAFVAGCGAMKSKEPPPKPFIGTKWVVVLELPVQGEQPWLRFGDGRMEGFGGCNRIASRYGEDMVGARAIVIYKIDRGTRGCDPSTQLAEARLLEVLQSVSSYNITIDQLVMSGSGGVIRLKSDPPAEVKP